MKNFVEVEGAVAKIQMSHGFVTLVDRADLELIADYRWYAGEYSKTYYAVSGHRNPVYLHSLLLPCSKGLIVDHKNRNGLDNRRCNLRRCTHSQNHANGPRYSNNKSGYRGVAWAKHTNRYAARISVNGDRTHLGYFVDPIDAALAYNEAAVKAWGEFAYLNDVNQNSNRIKEQG